jgi:hypothetical protein
LTPQRVEASAARDAITPMRNDSGRTARIRAAWYVVAVTDDPRIATWLARLHERHVAPYRAQEFTRALRALSARYVERRVELGARSPLDSAGKRAAFAAYYAPVHFFTVQRILGALPPFEPSGSVIDLGCGTGVAGAAVAFGTGHTTIVGVDGNAWSLGEAQWNWKALQLDGRTKRGNMIDAATAPLKPGRRQTETFVLGWAVNELDRTGRDALLAGLLAHARAGAGVLIVEPIARGAAPWWDDWARAFTEAGGRADEWKFPAELPPSVRQLGDSAGLDTQTLKAKSLSLR